MENARPEKLTVLIDSACPLCRREVRLIKKHDPQNRVGIVDIAAPEFDASAYGLDNADVNAVIHAIEPDGRVIRGMDVFRRVYGELGLGWLLRWTGWPVLRPICDAAYRLFAKVRPHLPGRRESCGV